MKNKKIGITADSSSGVEYAPFDHNIKITRTFIHLNKQELLDGIDIKADEFYSKLGNIEEVPTTSAPTAGEIMKRVNELKEEGCTDVIHFGISSGLSSYILHIKNVIDDMVTGINFHTFDSMTACLMEGYNAKYAEVLAGKGYDVDDIIKECRKFQQSTKAYFVVGNLKYLVKNGRLSNVSGIVGTIASIKPILRLGSEGKIIPFKKVRTNKKANAKLLSLILDEYKKYKEVIYMVLHSDRLEDAIATRALLEKTAKNNVRIDVTTITPTVGAHIGPGVLGIAAIALDDLNEKLF